MDREDFGWRKASYSNHNGACVEVANVTRVVKVRDTTDRDGATLDFTPEAWQAFTTGIRAS